MDPKKPSRYHGGVDLQPDGTLASEGGYFPQQRGLGDFAYITVESARRVNPSGNVQIIKVMPGQNPVLRTRQPVLEETEMETARKLEHAQKMTEEEKKKQDEKRDSDRERRPKKDSSSPRSRSSSRSPRASTSN